MMNNGFKMMNVLKDIVCKIRNHHYRDIYKKEGDNNVLEDDIDNEDIKTSISKLIKKHEKYFLYEIEHTTIDHIISGYPANTTGYTFKISQEIFEKYGIFMYVNDLASCAYAPRGVESKLKRLIKIYGIEKITEEIAIYLNDKYPNLFCIRIVCDQ